MQPSRLKAFAVLSHYNFLIAHHETKTSLGNKMVFLTYSWSFLRYDKLEQLEFKLEKIIVIEKHAGKVGKCQNFRDTISGWLTAFACFAPKKSAWSQN